MRIGLDVSPTLFDRGGSTVYVQQLEQAMRPQLSAGDSLVGLRPPGRRWRRGSALWKAQVLFSDLVWTPYVLPLVARGQRVDVLHAVTYKAPTRCALPLVVTVHDIVPLRHPEWFGRWSSSFAQRILPKVIAAADRVLVDCEFSRRELAAVFPAHTSKVVVVPLGVKDCFVPRGPQAADELRERLRLRRPFVLAVGTIEPRKNLRTLILAFARLCAEPDVDLDLVIAGASGWGLDARATAVDASVWSRVRWLGHVEDDELSKLYSAAAVFVFPSLFEGFGLPPLEALACGASVVCSNRPPMTELLGDAAVFTDALDDEALAMVIRDTVSHPDPGRRERGLTTARRFRWERTAQATLDVYRAVVAERRGGRLEHG